MKHDKHEKKLHRHCFVSMFLFKHEDKDSIKDINKCIGEAWKGTHTQRERERALRVCESLKVNVFFVCNFFTFVGKGFLTKIFLTNNNNIISILSLLLIYYSYSPNLNFLWHCFIVLNWSDWKECKKGRVIKIPFELLLCTVSYCLIIFQYLLWIKKCIFFYRFLSYS